MTDAANHAKALRALLESPIFLTLETRKAISTSADIIEQQAAQIATLRSAVEPFANRVFNDNGDVTVTDIYKLTADNCIAAYFAYRATIPPTGR